MFNKFKKNFIKFMIGVLLVVSFMPNIIDAQKTEFDRWQQKVAIQNNHWQQLNEQAKAVAEKLQSADKNPLGLATAKAAGNYPVKGLRVALDIFDRYTNDATYRPNYWWDSAPLPTGTNLADIQFDISLSAPNYNLINRTLVSTAKGSDFPNDDNLKCNNADKTNCGTVMVTVKTMLNQNGNRTEIGSSLASLVVPNLSDRASKLAASAIDNDYNPATLSTSSTSSIDNSDYPPAPDGTTRMTGEQCQNDPVCSTLPTFGVLAEPTAVWGDIAPIGILAYNAKSIAKITLSISDPVSNKSFYKDDFTNVKKQDQIYYEYDWDTLLAQTNVDSANSTHTALAEFYKDNGKGGFTSIGRATATIKITAFSSFDPMTDGFWGGYLRNDGSYSQDWKVKLGCDKSADLCKDIDSTKTAISTAIASGQVTEQDVNDLIKSFSRYNTQLSKSSSGNDETMMQTVANCYNMTDLIGVVNDQMDTKVGIPISDMDEAFLKSPESITILQVVNQYSSRIASYNPQTLDEWKAMPFWPQMSNEILNKISRDPANLINSIDDVTPASLDTTTTASNHNSFALFMNPTGVAKATDPIGFVTDGAFLIADTIKMFRDPSIGNAAWILGDVALGAVDVVLGGGGELHAAIASGKAAIWMATHFPKVVEVYRVTKGVIASAKIGERVGAFLTRIGGGAIKEAIIKGGTAVTEYLAAHPNLAKIVDRINPFKAKYWAWAPGIAKKFITKAKAAAWFVFDHIIPFANLAAHVAGDSGKCEYCADAKKWWTWFTPSGAILNTLCELQCVIINWIASAVGFVVDKVLLPSIL